jgi:hypothetical protein
MVFSHPVTEDTRNARLLLWSEPWRAVLAITGRAAPWTLGNEFGGAPRLAAARSARPHEGRRVQEAFTFAKDDHAKFLTILRGNNAYYFPSPRLLDMLGSKATGIIRLHRA